MGWREFCVGGISGALLSVARPPAGITLEEWITPSGERQAIWRAVTLIVIALALTRPRARDTKTRFPAAQMALGAACGFALHGLVLIDFLPIDSTASWVLALIVGFVALVWCGRSTGEFDGSVLSTPVFQRLALALCGGGLALTLGAVNSRLCLFGGGTRDDDTITGATALLLFGLAALAFSPLLARRRLQPAWFVVGLALAAACALPSLDYLAALSSPRAFTGLLARFGLDADLRGTLRYDAWLAARVFALPALLAGAAFASVRSLANLGWVLLGVAIAAILLPNWREGFSATTLESVAVQASERAALGAGLAALGGLVAALTALRGPWKTRTAVALCSAACLVFASTWNKARVLTLSPWEKVEPRVEWIRETPEGVLTVELQAGRGRIATLDRRRLTPTLEESADDELRLRNSLGEPGERAFVVLGGLLTPQRAMWLRVLEVPEVWCLSPWPKLDAELETALFAGETRPSGMAIEHGRGWLSVESSGVPGRILCPPVECAARTLSCLDRSSLKIAPTPAIGWLPAHQDIAQLDWSPRVLASCAHIDGLSIGVTSLAGLPNSLPAGPRSMGGTLFKLRLAVPERQKSARIHAAARLVHGEAGPAARAAQLLCAAQVPSSPYETRAQRTESDSAALDLLRVAGLADEPQGFERELDEFVARTLEQRRDLEGLTAFAVPLADAHPGWAVLQRAAARADWEFFNYADAARRLRQVVEANPFDLQARLWLSESLLRAEQPAAAIAAAEELLAIQPGRFDALRLRAIAAARGGDARAGEWVGALLREHPDDAELAAHAGVGPFPALGAPGGVPGEESGL